MNSIKEALRVAEERERAKITPQSKEEMRHQRELGELAREFRQVGLYWRLCVTSGMGYDEAIRQRWKEMMPKFTAVKEGEKIAFLYQFSVGLGVSEEDARGLNVFNKYPLDVYKQMLDGRKFSRASRIFIEVIGDISAFNDRQKNSLRNSLNSRKDTSQKHVHLQQTFPGVAHLLAS